VGGRFEKNRFSRTVLVFSIFYLRNCPCPPQNSPNTENLIKLNFNIIFFLLIIVHLDGLRLLVVLFLQIHRVL